MQGQRLTCGPFQIDPATQVVHRDGQLLPLGQKAALLLAALFRRPGEVLTKTELMDAAWADVAVEESNLTVQIAALRKALGPTANGTASGSSRFRGSAIVSSANQARPRGPIWHRPRSTRSRCCRS